MLVTQYPYHYMTFDVHRTWYIHGPFRNELRRVIANTISKAYPMGTYLCNGHGYRVAFIHANGRIEDLHPPYKMVPLWAMANAPCEPDCRCQKFLDNETQEPWGMNHQGHHPVCAWAKGGIEVAAQIQRAYETRKEGNTLFDRPDHVSVIQKSVLEK